MDIERWAGMPPGECEPGKVWFHATETVEDGHGSRPKGYLFQARPDATDADLRRLAGAAKPKT